MDEPTHLDLFSGIGGFALAAQWAGFRTIGFCEIDKYCQKVLAKNFVADSESKRESSESSGSREGILQSTGSCRIFRNIFDLDGREFAGVSLVTGGFPCQPFSVAGKRRGAADNRAIWPEMFRVIKEARPAWVLGENVPGIIPMELDNVLSDLESIGYVTRPFVIPACAVDARHRRDRLWIVAKSNAERRGWRQDDEGETAPERNGAESASLVANSESKATRHERSQRKISQCCEWLPEPGVCRVAHGVPSRVDRLRGLGNAIVPQVAYEILREIRKLI